jgi:hypothetical protein
MKIIYIFLFFFCFYSYAQENYIVKINESVLEIALDSTYFINVNGKDVNLTFKSKEILNYEDSMFSFQYPSDFKISKTVIEEGIEQIMMMTAEGSGVLIQKYENFDPTMLNEMMINEVTKESVNYGFKLERKEYEKTLKSNQNIKVDKAILTYKDEINIYEIASIGKKDEGILIMTMTMDSSMVGQGKKLIDLMWKTLIYK